MKEEQETQKAPIYQVWDYLKSLEFGYGLEIRFSYLSIIDGRVKIVVSESHRLDEFQQILKTYSLESIHIYCYFIAPFEMVISIDQNSVECDCKADYYEFGFESTGIEEMAAYMGLANEINQIYKQ